MPARAVISRELAQLFAVLAHPDRIRLVEELRLGEVDVNHLQAALGISHSRVSQHLAILRAHRFVTERREGRHVHYRLSQPAIAQWVLAGATFLTSEINAGEQIRSALGEVQQMWGDASLVEEAAT
jgi:DNA-binding transcriptional ArsR family regulator